MLIFFSALTYLLRYILIEGERENGLQKSFTKQIRQILPVPLLNDDHSFRLNLSDDQSFWL